MLRSIGGWAELKEVRDLGIRIKGDERLLGSSDFVERVLKQADEQLEEKYRLRMNAISLQKLIDKVARYYKTEAENLKSSSKKRRVTEARRALCYTAVRKLGYKCSDVSKAMGISAVKIGSAHLEGPFKKVGTWLFMMNIHLQFYLKLYCLQVSWSEPYFRPY